MKTIWSKLFLFAFICFVPLQMASAETSISGSQNHAKLNSSAVTLSKPMTITKVSGNNAGFWIQKGSDIVAKFYKQNDPAAVGRTLPAGTYTVYPNVPQGQKSANVTVSLK